MPGFNANRLLKVLTLTLFVNLLGISRAMGDNLKVGVILPLSGDFGYFGEQVRQGIEIALDEIRASGAKIPEFIFEDDKCLGKDAVSAFRRLANEQKVSIIVGPACSAAIQSVAPVARQMSQPTLFLLDTGDPVSSLPDPLYSFGFDPGKMAETLAADLHQRNIKTLATITEEEEYSVLITKAFEKRWKALGGEILDAEFQPVNSPDSRSSITRALSKKPQAMFYSSAYLSGTFLKQLRSLSSDIPVYGNDTMCTAETMEIAGEAANGARCANVVLDDSLPQVQAFRSALEKNFRKAPSSLFYPALGYDSVRLVLRELHLPPMSGRPLLGVEQRSATGVYDVIPSILEIRDQRMENLSTKSSGKNRS